MQRLSSNQIISIFSDKKDKLINGYIAEFKDFDPEKLIPSWVELLRAIEEFINLRFYIDRYDYKKIKIIKCDARNLDHNKNILLQHIKGLPIESIERISRLFEVICNLVLDYELRGLYEVIPPSLRIIDIEDAIEYYQARRAYYVFTFYQLPYLCKGKNNIGLHPLDQFGPIVEIDLPQVVTCHNHILVGSCLKDYTFSKNAFNYKYEYLDNFYSVPQRIDLYHLQILENGTDDQSEFQNSFKNFKPFEYSEMLIELERVEKIYSEFDSLHSDTYIKALEFIKALEKYTKNGFSIKLSRKEFNNDLNEICDESTSSNIYSILVDSSTDFLDKFNSYKPFITYKNMLFSTTSLLLRFIVVFKNIDLNSKKKFYVRAGFIFEKQVMNILKKYGFEYADGQKITRIKGREFDLIVKKNDKYYNLQCKNYYLDSSNIKLDESSFCKQNLNLLKRYDYAYEKEINRESLILDRLGISDIKHYIVSRFPVITRNPKVIIFQDLEEWASKV